MFEHFDEVPKEVLEGVLELFEKKYPPAEVMNHRQLESPLELAFKAGASSVVRDLRSIIRRRTEPKE